jgi:hypothetical protein
MTFAISACSARSPRGGVPFGTKMPSQPVASKPGKPDSATVGTSGSAALRFGEVTARPRTLPPLMCGDARRDRQRGELHVAAEQVGDRRRRALVRHLDPL